MDRDPHTAIAPSALTPILITGPGRSGTTLVMGLLAQAPEIVVAGEAPYETRLLSYYANAHNVLTHPADMVRSTHADQVQGDGFHIGFNPYNGPIFAKSFSNGALVREYVVSYVPNRVDEVFRDIVIEYYRRLATDKHKSNVRFFAEKNNNLQNLVRTFARRAFGGVREIVTIRDPRDVLCSHLAYFKAEAERSFTDIGRAARLILNYHADAPQDMYFNSYERLLRREPACLGALSEFLQIELGRPTDEARNKDFARHGTSPNADATVERWRTDMTQDWKDRCLHEWRPFLETFGYPLT